MAPCSLSPFSRAGTLTEPRCPPSRPPHLPLASDHPVPHRCHHEVLRDVLFLLPRSTLAGRPGIEQIMLARSGRSAARRARPRRNPAATVLLSPSERTYPHKVRPPSSGTPFPASSSSVASPRCERPPTAAAMVAGAHSGDHLARAAAPCAPLRLLYQMPCSKSTNFNPRRRIFDRHAAAPTDDVMLTSYIHAF